MKTCVDCDENRGRVALLTHSSGHVNDFILCESCFKEIRIGSGWVKKEWKAPTVIDTLKNPREAVMF